MGTCSGFRLSAPFWADCQSVTGLISSGSAKALVMPACPEFAVARDGVVFEVTLVKHLFAFHGVNGPVVKDESHLPILKTQSSLFPGDSRKSTDSI